MNIFHKIFGQTESPDDVIRRVTKLLQPHFTDLFSVYYEPAFPRRDHSTFSLFQVVFAVGPGEDAKVRDDVLLKFKQLLELLAPLPEVQHSAVNLCARRHAPPHSPPDHPYMFIECGWYGSEVAEMLRKHNFVSWHSYCCRYINRFDENDALNKVAMPN